MPFVKLDCGILDSSLWIERDAREVFITALLMAVPHELSTQTPTMQIRSMESGGWDVPPGWYGLIRAAGVGILHRSGIDVEAGYRALEQLAQPDPASRSDRFDGRRLVRINGGFVVLNYFAYRDRDYTAAIRSKRYRDRLASRRDGDVTQRYDRDATRQTRDARRNITHAEAEAEAEAEKIKIPPPPPTGAAHVRSPPIPDAFETFWLAYPRKTGKGAALRAWTTLQPPLPAVLAALVWQAQQPGWTKDGGEFIPHPATWLRRLGWQDEPTVGTGTAEVVRGLTRETWWADCQARHLGVCGTWRAHDTRVLLEDKRTGLE